MDIEKYITEVPDFPKKGILFYDITPLMGNPQAYRNAISEMGKLIKSFSPTKIMAAESRGFFFGPPIAIELGLPFVPIRKKGKLPRKTLEVGYSLEYATDMLCVHCDDISAGDKIVVLDDILATGGTATAMCDMAEKLGAEVVCCAFFMELLALGGREKLSGRKVVSLLQR